MKTVLDKYKFRQIE